MMSNAEIFIDKFKVLEDLLRRKFNILDYNKSALNEIENKPQFKHLKSELIYIRDIRNILQHKPTFNGEYPIQPNSEIINNVQKVINYINNPPKAYDKCIQIQNVCYVKEDDLIYPIMLKMKDNVYTHIPILENGVVQGVFSENTLFGALIEDELIYQKDFTKFNTELIQKYCNIRNHVSETFAFIPREIDLEDVKEMFLKSFQNKQRLAMLFVTQHGRPEEKLLGIITPWDVLGKS